MSAGPERLDLLGKEPVGLIRTLGRSARWRSIPGAFPTLPSIRSWAPSLQNFAVICIHNIFNFSSPAA